METRNFWLAVILALATVTQAVALIVTIKSAKSSTQLQLRAYLSVEGFGAVYQDTATGAIFEGKPKVSNHGKTPAHKLNYWANCGILPKPLPPDEPLPKPKQIHHYSNVIGIEQDYILNARLETLVPAADEVTVRRGTSTTAFYCWGRVEYEDVFGDPHHTNFCQWYTWYPVKRPDGSTDEMTNLFWAERHNDAD